MNTKTFVQNRKGVYQSVEISKNQFVLLIGVFTLMGLIATAVVAYFTTGWMELVPAHDGFKATYEWVGPVNIWIVMIGTLVSGIVGVIIAQASDKPAISLLGLFMIAIPFGLLVGPTVGMFTPDSVTKVIVITGLVTAVLTLIGTVIPESLGNWTSWLFGGLLVLLIGSVGIPFLGWLIPGFPIHGALTAMDWFGVVVFSGYIIYDINQALRMEYTVDNAADAAVDVYLDIINLFLRLLRLLGQKKID